MSNTSERNTPADDNKGLANPLAKTVLDSLSANIAILDGNGVILETNRAWRRYANLNDADDPHEYLGANYLAICDAAEGEGASDAHAVAAGIRSVINGETEEFLYDYPCHSATGRHWYYMRAIKMEGEGETRVVVSHSDITKLKLAEEALLKREQERDRLRHSLELAMEVQQSLLPDTTPRIKGLDICGKSIYCDETGGDYYDFIKLGKGNRSAIALLVGDVSGHGIHSALLMASARASLRQRLASPGSIAEIIADVNVQLTHDVHSSSRFVTLFYLVIETQQGKLRWGRAGHEPAIFYDGKTKEFEELKGSGMALGINPAARYEENQRSPLAKGSIIVLYTDGIWEARNDQNDMFGKARICDIIRRHASAPAETIMNAILEAVQVFQGSAAFEDDATLVVAKILEDLG